MSDPTQAGGAASPPAIPPAATGGGFTLDQVKAIVADAIKPFAEQIKEIGAQAKIANDTLAQLPPAKPESKPTGKTDGLTLEAVQKLLDDRDKAATAKAQREATIAGLVKEKLGGNAALAAALTGDTPDQLAESADKLAASLKPVASAPHIGGAGRAGGTPPTQQAVDYSKLPISDRMALGRKLATTQKVAG
jgi:hypothetical protein